VAVKKEMERQKDDLLLKTAEELNRMKDLERTREAQEQERREKETLRQ